MDRGEGGLGWGKYYFKHMWLIQFQAAWCDFFVLTDQIIFQTNQSSYRCYISSRFYTLAK